MSTPVMAHVDEREAGASTRSGAPSWVVALLVVALVVVGGVAVWLAVDRGDPDAARPPGWSEATPAVVAIVDGTLESLNRGDIDGGYGAVFLPDSGPGLIPFASESADGIPDHKQISQELRLESDYGGRFDWQAGVFWFDETISVDSFSYDSLAANNPQNGYATQRQENTAWAVFASADFEATERLTLRFDCKACEMHVVGRRR